MIILGDIFSFAKREDITSQIGLFFVAFSLLEQYTLQVYSLVKENKTMEQITKNRGDFSVLRFHNKLEQIERLYKDKNYVDKEWLEDFIKMAKIINNKRHIYAHGQYGRDGINQRLYVIGHMFEENKQQIKIELTPENLQKDIDMIYTCITHVAKNDILFDSSVYMPELIN